MDLLFFILVLGFFGFLCAIVGPVGGEGERDLARRSCYPPVPLHHV